MSGFKNAERLTIYTHLRLFESDFDKSQSQMRAICSAWSAAVVGAIALIVVSAATPPSGMKEDLVKDREVLLALLRGLVCIVGSAGVFAFWFIDQRIYQKLLHTVFAYGLLVETKNEDLPQIRSALITANSDITTGLAWFYRVQFFTFLAIALTFVWQPFGMKLGPTPIGITPLFVVHAAIVICGELYSRRWPSLRSIIAKTYPREVREIPQFGKLCEASTTLDRNRMQGWRKRIWNSLLLKQEETSGRDSWTATIKPAQSSLSDMTEVVIEKAAPPT